MRVYIAGPMRGIPQFNFPAFDEAEKRWRDAGHEPMSPASIDRAMGFTPDTLRSEVDDIFLRRALALDIQCIYHAEAIALLPGWQSSSGATLELALALCLKLKVFDAVSMERVVVVSHPWSNHA